MPMHEDKPELLAPAGNEECLHAAVTAGADAVYLGLDEFNARRNAGNFTLDSLGPACDYAHLRGVAVYLTLNVEVLPSEIARAVRLGLDAYAAGADALIIQDIGLASELSGRLPREALHLSTQMNVHNAAGIAAAAQLGASRVTLSRELSVAEIAELAALAADFDMEVECFAHGALCICYSGQCLMSSMIGGRSANRGLCAQACRLPYGLHRAGDAQALSAPGEHLLSPKDLCTIDVLDDLRAAGVASLKVEGRMKSPDYVFEVISVYRAVLDSGRAATDLQKARLAEAFSRGFTTAYLEGERGNDMMSYGRPNNRGVFAGRVARVGDGLAEIVPEVALNDGDVLEFWTNRGHFAATVTDARPGKDGTVRVPVDKKTGKGDRVFRVRNAAASFADDPYAPRIPVRGSVSLRLGKPARIGFEAGTGARFARAEAVGDIVEPARTKPVSPQDVFDHVNRLGNTPFELAAASDLAIEVDEGVGIGFSQLHRMRSDALCALESRMLDAAGKPAAQAHGVSHEPGAQARAASRKSGVKARAASRKPDAQARSKRESFQVMAWATNPSCARAAKRAGADGIYVPLLNFRRGQSQLAGVRQAEAEQAGYPKQCVMALPVVDHDPVPQMELREGGSAYPATREFVLSFDMWDYVRAGKPVFADNLGDALRALEAGAQVEVGPRVIATNAATLERLASWGVSRVWLSPELTLGQIADLAEVSPVPLGLVAYGAQELMVTEHCLLMSQGPCARNCGECARRGAAHRLVDRKGFEFPVVTDMYGRSHLYNGIELDAIPCVPDFADIGISAVMVDTTLLDRKSSADAVGRAIRARDLAAFEHRGVGKRPNTTTGHLFRGVS